MDSDQDGGAAPVIRILLKRVERMWWIESNLYRIPYVIPSGPGDDFWFDFFSTPFISLGRKCPVLNGAKEGEVGSTGRCGNQWRGVGSKGGGSLYVRG